MKVGIVFSTYYEIGNWLLKGAKEFFQEKEISIPKEDCIPAPGAFEIPLLAKALAKTGKYDGIVCLGCVVKGETAHFEYICLGVTMGISQVSLETNLPITFGVLTTYNREQAHDRSVEGKNNKGYEAAQACWKAILALQKIQ